VTGLIVSLVAASPPMPVVAHEAGHEITTKRLSRGSPEYSSEVYIAVDNFWGDGLEDSLGVGARAASPLGSSAAPALARCAESLVAWLIAGACRGATRVVVTAGTSDEADTARAWRDAHGCDFCAMTEAEPLPTALPKYTRRC
jgi:hypothetical protein